VRLIRVIIGGVLDVFASEKVRGLLFFTLGLLTLATILFRWLEGWSWVDAAFFALTTISTVGYGNLVPATTAGKIVTMAFILIGLGVFVAATSAVAEAILQRRERERARAGRQAAED